MATGVSKADEVAEEQADDADVEQVAARAQCAGTQHCDDSLRQVY